MKDKFIGAIIHQLWDQNVFGYKISDESVHVVYQQLFTQFCNFYNLNEN